mmetsp:Transcript_40363/g.71759  ORF Transcript_40363/g.71759 Transcript_40363/m.71759 type:complete len:176 (-) Transcript_40363:17-544(-)
MNLMQLSSPLLRNQISLKALGRSTRHIHKGGPKKSQDVMSSIVSADQGMFSTKFFHKTQTGLLFAFPLMFILGPPYVFPVDLAMGVALPVHGHIGMNYVVSDYAPKAWKLMGLAKGTARLGTQACRVGVLGASAAAFLGLTYLNLAGPGISETLKDLYRAAPADGEKEKAAEGRK